MRVKLRFAFFLIFVIFMCTISFAEGVDLNELSDYDLLNLDLNIHQVLYDRNLLDDHVLYPGAYVVGRDIESGSYVFSVLEFIDGSFSGQAYISFYRNEDDFSNFKAALEKEADFQRDTNGKAQFNLNDGEVIQLNYGVFQAIRR